MPPAPRLDPAFLDRPIAHRALHDRKAGRPENSRAAIREALARGYGIEVDIQPSADQHAMVFHDYDLGRLTGSRGPVRLRSARELGDVRLKGDTEGIPTLAEVLDLVAGRVPLLIEIKDQDLGLGPDIGPLEEAVARVLAGYPGPVAVMSFNPHVVARMAELLPDVPRGLVTSGFPARKWPLVKAERRRELAAIPDIERVGASFISHDRRDLGRARVREIKDGGLPVLTWTVRSPAEEEEARKVADNITFEGYLPRMAA